jgi:hypothetical protein
MSEPTRAQPVVVVLGADNTITLPEAVAQKFQPTDRFVLLQQDDTIILKRIVAPSISAIVEAAPDEPAMSLDEISDIVHELRSERRAP